MDLITWIWLAGLVVFVALEAVTYQLVSIWFAIGVIGALIAKAIGADFTVQIIVFIALSGICLLCLRPVSKKLIKNNPAATNVDSLIGAEAVVTSDINNLHGKGEGKVNGMTWTMRSADNTDIKAGAKVTVEKVEGVKLIVKRKEDV